VIAFYLLAVVTFCVLAFVLGFFGLIMLSWSEDND